MRATTMILTLTAVACAATPALAKKKKAEPTPPPIGKLQVGDMTCYAPPDFATLTESQRKVARSEALQYLTAFIGEGIQPDFQIADEEDRQYFETAFLGRPSLLDDWLATNFDKCKEAAKGAAQRAAYLEYLSGIGRELEANECYRPLTYEYHNFMDVQTSWQFRIHACKDDRVLIETTGEDNGKYTLENKGKPKDSVYIIASGQPVLAGRYEGMKELPPEAAAEAAGDRGPVADALWGAVVMRFEAEDGSYTKYFTVGNRLEWKAPDHGFISFTVNDTTLYDNAFHDLKGAIDYLGLDIYPAIEESKNGVPAP